MDIAIHVARIRPDTVADSLRQAFLIYFRPSADYPLFDRQNRHKLHAVVRSYDAIVLGQARAPHDYDFMDLRLFRSAHIPGRLAEVGWVIVLGYATAVSFGASSMRRAFGAEGRTSAQGIVMAYVLLTIAYVSVLGNVLDADNRVRFVLDPLVLTLVGLLVSRLWSRARGLRPAAAAEPLCG